jgi:uncharacterized Zn-binding protein involved in type VI secretion
MPGRPAARLLDATAHGNPLSPGTCSPNVIIGKKLAWRGLPLAQVAQLLNSVGKLMEAWNKNVQATKDLAANPANIKAAKDLKDSVEEIKDNTQTIASIMGTVDQHACAVVKVAVPDGTGVVIDGSQTVLINGLPACRMGDTIQEMTSVNKIVSGEFTVLIGG